MRTATIIVIAGLLLPLFPSESGAAGRYAAEPGIGLYTNEARSGFLVNNTGGISQFVMWIWVRPGDGGAMCAEYEIATPYNVIVTGIIPNPDAPITVGEPVAPPGVRICFQECRTAWFWTYQVEFLVTDMAFSMITVEPHDTSGGILLTTCAPDNPTEPMCVFHDLFINHDFGVEDSSWGAIKGMLE